jgi:predicted MFS family arabinose efflux permease
VPTSVSVMLDPSAVRPASPPLSAVTDHTARRRTKRPAIRGVPVCSRRVVVGQDNADGAFGGAPWLQPLSINGTSLRAQSRGNKPNHGRVDIRGAAILGVSLTGLLIAISRGADWGWTSPKTAALMLVGFNGLALFAFLQRRTRQPLVNMATFARRPVLTTNIATLLIGSAMISTFVLVPQLGQLPKGGEIGFGLSATEAGLLLAPGGLASLLIAPFIGRIGERSGSKTPFLAGCLVVAGALLGLALAHGSVGLVVLWSCLVSLGSGAAFAAIPNLIVGAVSDRETGEATGVNTIMRNIGSAIGAQIAGSLIATHILASGLPQNAGFEIAFLISAAGAIVAALSVLLIPGHSREPRAEMQPAAASA